MNDSNRPTRAEAEKDEQGRKPYEPTEAEYSEMRRTDPWNPENQRKRN